MNHKKVALNKLSKANETRVACTSAYRDLELCVDSEDSTKVLLLPKHNDQDGLALFKTPCINFNMKLKDTKFIMLSDPMKLYVKSDFIV